MKESSAVSSSLIWCCCGLCRGASKLSFGWKRRRHIWRATVFYSVLAVLVCLGVLLTATLLTLIDKRSFFWNYRCGGRAVRLICWNFAGMIGLTGLTGLAALLMARLTNTFSNYSVSDMMAVGKCADRMGLLVKWVPWFTAASIVAWMVFNLVNLIWILAAPKDWCSRRWSDTGIQAVRNCRLWYSGKAPCLDPQTHSSVRKTGTFSCNDGEFLEKLEFFWFTPNKDSIRDKGITRRCSFETMAICLTYLRHFSSFATADSSAVAWQSEALQHCRGHDALGEPPEAFQEPDTESSDLYKYVCTYVVGWNIASLVIMCFFYYLKLSSNFESMVYQPPNRENFFYSLVRPLTPWTS